MHTLPTLTSLGWLETPFREKFGIPRQAHALPDFRCKLHLQPEFARAEAWRGLERFSHVWVISCFHAHTEHRPALTVRPPKLGGKQRLGVFATRAPHRPNPLGLSLTPHYGFEQRQGQAWLNLGPLDLLHGTPVLDIKPYLPEVEQIATAYGQLPPQAPRPLTVHWSPQASAQAQRIESLCPGFIALLEAVLQQDPRPGFHDQARDYGLSLYQWNIRGRVDNGCITLLELTELPSTP